MVNFALFENAGKPDSAKWAEESAKFLLGAGHNCCARLELISRFSSDIASKITPLPYTEFEKFADFILSFGGDGTMLSAARYMINSELPIVGFNVGNLGFLAEYSVTELEEALSDLVNSRYRIVDRSVFETEIEGETIYALNDFVVEKLNSSRMITVRAYSNEKYIGDYRADGLIVTTPTGSTAYSLSCGGPIISPMAPVMCLTPISPHSLNLRPLIIPDTSEVKLMVFAPNQMAKFVADGFIEKVLKNGESFTIRLSPKRVKLVKPLKSVYYDLLRKKLLWATHTLDDGTRR